MVVRVPLRSRTGCARCKERRKKCDETYPRCRFCKRWGLDCVWPTNNAQDNYERFSSLKQQSSNPAISDIDEISNQSLALPKIPETQRLRLDPFHKLPIDDGQVRPGVIDCLRYFFTCMVRDALPFELTNATRNLAGGWLEMILSDAVVCWSFVAYCAQVKARRHPENDMTKLCLYSGGASSFALRHRLTTEKMTSEGTLLAATVHYIWAALTGQSTTKMRTLFSGIEALINARGGYMSLVQQINPSIRQSIGICDMTNSLFCADPPHYPEILVASPLLQSLHLAHRHIDVKSSLGIVIDPCVMEALCNCDIVLFFRIPSSWHLPLTAHESQFIMSLLRQIDYQLCAQQARLLGSQTISEILVLGLILVKQTIIAKRAQLHSMIIKILRRLQTAIMSCKYKSNDMYPTIAIWASVVAFDCIEGCSDGPWFVDFVKLVLNDRYQAEIWPLEWPELLRIELEQVLWHALIENKFVALCQELSRYEGLGHQQLGMVNTR